MGIPDEIIEEYDIETEAEMLDFWYDEVLCSMDDEDKVEVF